MVMSGAALRKQKKKFQQLNARVVSIIESMLNTTKRIFSEQSVTLCTPKNKFS